MSSDKLTLRPLARCRVADSERYSLWVCTEVRRHMVTLQADGVPAIEIAESIGVSRTTLYRWRNGDESPTVQKFLLLCDLADDVKSARKVGT